MVHVLAYEEEVVSPKRRNSSNRLREVFLESIPKISICKLFFSAWNERLTLDELLCS